MTKRLSIAITVLLLPLLLFASCGGGGEESPSPSLPPQICDLGAAFRNNITDTEKSYVFCKITIEVSTEEELEIINANISAARNIVNEILRAKTYDELKNKDATETLREEIAVAIASLFGFEQVRSVNFTEYYTV